MVLIWKRLARSTEVSGRPGISLGLQMPPNLGLLFVGTHEDLQLQHGSRQDHRDLRICFPRPHSTGLPNLDAF
jgi:hypothetical protein